MYSTFVEVPKLATNAAPGAMVKMRALELYRTRLVLCLTVNLFARSGDLDKVSLLCKYVNHRIDDVLSIRLYKTKEMQLRSGSNLLAAELLLPPADIELLCSAAAFSDYDGNERGARRMHTYAPQCPDSQERLL